MKKFLCVVIEIPSMKDVKEYEVSARDKYDAHYQVEALYKIASHYTPRLPSLEDVYIDLVEI